MKHAIHFSLGVLLLAASAPSQSPELKTVLEKPAIRGPLTLKYRVERRTVLPPDKKKKWDHDRLADLQRQWRISGVSESEIARWTAEERVRQADTRQNYEVVFSCSGPQLYYEATRTDVPKDEISPDRVIIYYDGVKTYRLIRRSLRISEKMRFESLAFFPFLGVQLGDVALLRPSSNTGFYEQYSLPITPEHADVFIPDFKDTAFAQYIPGYVEFSRKGDNVRLHRLLTGDPRTPLSTAELFDYSTSLGFDIAKSYCWTWYYHDGGLSSPGIKRETTTYRVTSMELTFRGLDRDQLIDLLRRGDSVIVEPKMGDAKVYLFDIGNEELMKWFPNAKGSAGMFEYRVAIGACASVGVLVTWGLVKTIRSFGALE